MTATTRATRLVPRSRTGAEVTKEPVDAEFFAGRSAYLSDPEGDFIEVSWADPSNPIAARRARS